MKLYKYKSEERKFQMCISVDMKLVGECPPSSLHCPTNPLPTSTPYVRFQNLLTRRVVEKEDDDISSKLAFHADPDKLDDDGKPRNKVSRKMSRNESEKLRRDRLNAYIGELAKLVPLILTANRKMDKSSVLRLTVNYLRMYHDLAKNPEFRRQWRPEFLNAEHLGSMLLESTGGFLMVISRRGTLTFCTDAITQQLGHSLVDILGNPLYSIIHPDDHAILQQQFYPASDQPPTRAYPPQAENLLPRSNSRSFFLRMLDNGSKQNNKYQSVHIVAHIKCVPPVNMGSPQPGLGHLSEPDVCMVGVGRIHYNETPKELLPIMDANTDQWMTRHELDGKLTFSDPRCAYISGFMPEETNGMSPYAMLHNEDVGVVAAAHNIFMTTGVTPVTCFRMFTKSQDIIYVRTHTHMVVDMWTSKPRYIVSINEVLPEEEGKKVLEEVKSELLEVAESKLTHLSITGSPEDTADEKDKDDASDTLEPCSPQVPDVVVETQNHLDIYVDKTKVYRVDLNMPDLRRTDSKKSDNIVYDPYPPTNPSVSSQTVSSAMEISMSPKPVYLGASPQPSDADSLSGRSMHSRHSSFSSQGYPQSVGTNQGSPPMSNMADSASSPSNVSNIPGSHPGPNAQTLLQQLNKRMAAAPPQLQSILLNEQHSSAPVKLDSHFKPNGSGHLSNLQGLSTNHKNSLLMHILQEKPLELGGYDNGKIFSEIPGIDKWKELVESQRRQTAFDGGGGGGMTCSGVSSSDMGLCSDLGATHQTHLSHGLQHQYSGSHQVPGGTGYTSTRDMSNNTSPQSHAYHDRSNQSPNHLDSTMSRDVYRGNGSETMSNPASISSATLSASPSSAYQASSPPAVASYPSPPKAQQLQNQLDLLKEIEARREAHERALQALKQEYALQMKQLAVTDDAEQDTASPTLNSLVTSLTSTHRESDDAKTVSQATLSSGFQDQVKLAQGQSQLNQHVKSQLPQGEQSSLEPYSAASQLVLDQDSPHSIGYQFANTQPPVSTNSQMTYQEMSSGVQDNEQLMNAQLLGSSAGSVQVNYSQLSKQAQINSLLAQPNLTSPQLANLLASTQTVSNDLAKTEAANLGSTVTQTVNSDLASTQLLNAAYSQVAAGLLGNQCAEFTDTSLEGLVDNSLLLNGVGSADWPADNDVDINTLLSALSSGETQDNSAYTDSNLHTALVDGEPQGKIAGGQCTADGSLGQSGNTVGGIHAQDVYGDPSMQETKALLQKLKEANLTPAQYLKVLSQLHSSNSKNSFDGFSSQPITTQNTKNSANQMAPVNTLGNSPVSTYDTSSAAFVKTNFSIASTDTYFGTQSTHINELSSTLSQPLSVPNTSNSNFPDPMLQPTTSDSTHLPLQSNDVMSSSQSDVTDVSQNEVIRMTQRLLAASQRPSSNNSSSNNEQIVGILQQLIESGDRNVLDALLKGTGGNSMTKRASQQDLSVFNGS